MNQSPPLFGASALDDELTICAMERALRLVPRLTDPKARELAYCAAAIQEQARKRFDLEAINRAAIYRAKLAQEGEFRT